MARKKKAQSEQVAPSPKFNRSQNFAHYYVSQIGILTTTFDVSLFLGRIVAIEDGQMVVEQAAQATMSYQHAKALGKLLLEHTEAYEKANGIVLPYKPVPTPSSSETSVKRLPSSQSPSDVKH